MAQGTVGPTGPDQKQRSTLLFFLSFFLLPFLIPLLPLLPPLSPSQSLLAARVSQSMAAAAPAPASDVCAPTPGAARGKGAAVQAWKVLLGWLCFLLQMLLQVLRGTPSWAQLLSYIGLRHPLLPSSAAASESASIPFVPLSTEEVPTDTPPPPCQKESPDKLIVVLDLDETLVCAYETSSLPALIRSQAIEYGIKCFELECTSSDKDADGKQKVSHVTVFERPGLHEFLQQTSEFADLVLFTAGLEGYAKPLVDKIDVHKKFICRLYRPSTVATEYREHVKDLSCVTNDFSRIVLVDNNPFSFLLQPLNGIPCVPFSATQAGDNQLLGVILPLLKQLSPQEDVRPVLYETFHMPEWFNKHGIPPQPNQIL